MYCKFYKKKVLTDGKIIVCNNKVYAGKNRLDLTKDTVYKHPTAKQCNYSIDTSNFVTKNDLSYSPMSIGCVKRTVDGAVDWLYSDFDGISVSFSGTTGGASKTYTYNIDKSYPIYFISVSAMNNSSAGSTRGGGLSWSIYCNGNIIFTYDDILSFSSSMFNFGSATVPNPSTHTTVTIVVTYTVSDYYAGGSSYCAAHQEFNNIRIMYNTF